MRIVKYPQSCVVIEHDDGGRLLVDPGDVAMDVVDWSTFGAVDAVLFTHRHPDHCDARAVDHIGDAGVTVYANADVRSLLDVEAVEVTGGERFTAAGVDVLPLDLPHVPMVDGSAGPPNTGYVFDGRLLHPGDAVTPDAATVPALLVPIVGPSVSFRDAYRMIEGTGARRAVPVHYDTFRADPEQFAGFCDIATVTVLEVGESVDV